MNCSVNHPQPPKGGFGSKSNHCLCAAEVPFRACPEESGGF